MLKMSLSGSLWLSVTPTLALSDSHSDSHWLSLALTATLWHTLALSGSLLHSNFAYAALDRLTGPLLGSHRRGHYDALYPALNIAYPKFNSSYFQFKINCGNSCKYL